MDFQFISDADLLFPIASLVVASMAALFIGRRIPLKGAVSNSSPEGGDAKDMIAQRKSSSPYSHSN
ncbi:hypothetical protein LSCM1_04658 [Leishmania martiniquensis]|uniref:Uncharacterized protein n=1 Tax=Leishmania martiniquensis TaxID=1580590 RepID=A0A836HMM5_9TRYP|nr:hypothetical protein LSCM1_04658 [Leishmania martiniquensis]